MEYYLYCWLGIEKMANKCRFEERRDTKMPALAAELSPSEPFFNPSGEWYVIFVMMVAVLFGVSHMWIKRFLRARASLQPQGQAGIGHSRRHPVRPPRSLDSAEEEHDSCV